MMPQTHHAATGTTGTGAARKHAWGLGLLLMAAVVLAYQPVWHAGFIWDDDKFLVDNPLIQAPDGLGRFWFTTEAPDYFPLTSTTLWLEWRLWGLNPLGYHLVNVLLHALSAVWLWRVLAGLAIPGAWLAAALFALHPVNVESVAWITERKNTLAMCFYLLALLAYLRFEAGSEHRTPNIEHRTANDGTEPCRLRRSTFSGPWLWYGLALAAFGLALLSKSAVVMLPVVLLGIAGWRRGRIGRGDVLRVVPFFLLAAAAGLITMWFQSHRAIGEEVVRSDGFLTRLAGAGWAVWFYLGKVLLPLDLSFVYPRWRIVSTQPLSYVPGLVFGALIAAGWIYRRRWGTAWVCGLGYFALLLLPVLGFLDIYFMRYSLVADHWQYFAIIGPLALAAAGMTTVAGRWRSRWGGGGAAVGAVFCAGLLLMLALLTWRQAWIYQSSETLWADTLRKNPGCWIARNNLGLLCRDVDEAIAHHQKALQIEPDNALSHFNLGNALLQKGDRDGAIIHFQKAVELHPGHAEARLNLGNVLLLKGNADAAIVHFQKVLQAEPDHAEAHNNLGNALLQQGGVAEAMGHYRRTLELKPDSAEARLNLGNALLVQGGVDEAIALFQQALQRKPANAEAHYLLGNALLQKEREAEATAHFQRALLIKPDYADAQNNLAWVRATSPQASLRNGTEAVQLAERASQLAGGKDSDLLGTLAAAYAEAGRYDAAIRTAQKAVELALAAGRLDQVTQLNGELKLYSAGRPFHRESR